jgi:hypothetical protein
VEQMVDNASDFIVWFRIGERIALSLIVVTLSIIVMVAFWRSIQKVDFQASRDKIGAGGSIILATPVFVLLALIGFAFVSLSNPISVSVGESRKDVAAVGSSGSGVRKFVGMTSDNSSGRAMTANNIEFKRLRAAEKVMSLNCLLREAGKTSARVSDDVAAVKLGLLKPVWSKEWGNFEAFDAWALGRSREDPDSEARAVFDKVHETC